jgi:hypothetical protein
MTPTLAPIFAALSATCNLHKDSGKLVVTKRASTRISLIAPTNGRMIAEARIEAALVTGSWHLVGGLSLTRCAFMRNDPDLT